MVLGRVLKDIYFVNIPIIFLTWSTEIVLFGQKGCLQDRCIYGDSPLQHGIIHSTERDQRQRSLQKIPIYEHSKAQGSHTTLATHALLEKMLRGS